MYQKLQMSNITSNPTNARKKFTHIKELAKSIESIGLAHAIVVRPVEDGRYSIVAGERRYRACQLLQMESIDCNVLEPDAEIAEIISLAENVERKSLSSKEKADKVAELQMRTGCAQSNRALAKELSVSESYIRKLLKINNLPTDVKEKIENKELSQNAALKQACQQNASEKISDAANLTTNGYDEPEATDSKIISITEPSTPSVKEFYKSVMKLADMAMQINLDGIDIESIPHKRLAEITSRLGDAVAHLDNINNTVQAFQNNKEDKKRGVPNEPTPPTNSNLPISA